MRRSDGGIAVGSAVGAIGAAVVAIVSALCCAGPIMVIGALGAGSALVAARLQPYRPVFLGVSAALLALGFWRVYRRPTGGVACSVRTGRLVRSVLWIAAFITLASAVAPRFWS